MSCAKSNKKSNMQNRHTISATTVDCQFVMVFGIICIANSMNVILECDAISMMIYRD